MEIQNAPWYLLCHRFNFHRRSGKGLMGCVGVIVVVAAVSLQTATIPDTPSCGSCRIVTESVLLSDSGTTGFFSDRAAFSVGAGGEIYVVSAVDHARILRFSADGRFLGSFGRQGRGPEEFVLAVPPVVTRGDTINVFDAVQRRLTVFTARGEHVRTIPIPLQPVPLTPLADGRFVVNGNVGTREAAGYPLHVMDRDGAIEVSFGAETPAHRPDLPNETLRRVAIGPEGTVWAARVNSYTIEEWTSAGRLVRTLEVRAPWFEPWIRGVTRPDLTRPLPIIGKIWWSDGILWVVAHVPDREWRPDPRASPGGEGPAFSAIDNHQFFDTRVDAIDVEAGSLLATTTFGAYLVPAVDGLLLAEYIERPDLSPRFRVHRPRLVRAPRE